MIHKVNRPEFRLVVNSTKSAENDPGSSQGSGVAYEHLPDAPRDDRSNGKEQKARSSPELELVGKQADLNAQEASGQFEFGNLVLEYQGSKRDAPSRPGLTLRYQKESTSSRGLLLNKKAE